MPAHAEGTKEVPTYCALCISRCGATATLKDGRLASLVADPHHPTGKALCIKGKVSPELVYHPERLLQPLRRTAPKGAADPGWETITWDEALDTVAQKLTNLASAHGPETVVFSSASPSTSAIDDSMGWIRRLRRAFGSPNQSTSMELCGWGRWLANFYSYGTGFPAGVMPDLEHAGCILFWGYNPSVSRIAHATATTAAVKRGAKLIVVDPRNAGLAHRADVWLQVRPGSDGALALGLSQVLIAGGHYDTNFLKGWTNAPTLVRDDNGKCLRLQDLDPSASEDVLLAWSDGVGGPVRTELGDETADHALFGTFEVQTPDGPVTCQPVFQKWANVCAAYTPDRVEELTNVPAATVVRAAEMIWQSRPLAYMAWSGVEQQSNATQIAIAAGLLCALTGSYDRRGGNVEFPVIPTNNVQGDEFLSEAQRQKTLGRDVRPLGPARYDHVGSADIYRAILEELPYRVRGLVSFGSNLVMAHAASETAIAALKALEFYVHTDLFMNPTADFADIVLPVASPFETEALKVGFEISDDAARLVQLRQRLVPPRGECRSDTQIIFDLACRMGLSAQFWNGDVDAGMREILEPSGVTLDELREKPEGIRVELETHYQKYATRQDGRPRGFNTPSRRIEFYSEQLLAHGYSPLPDYEEPKVSHRSDAQLAPRYPLVLTCTKDTLFCETQHRNLPSLRRRAMEPQVDVHPETAAARGIAAGDWVEIATPHGAARARARFDASLAEAVVCGQHGWWQACTALSAPAYPATGPETANFNSLIGHDAVDDVSGSVPMRAYVCELRRLNSPPSETH